MTTRLLFLFCCFLFISCQDNEKFQVLRPLGGQVITGYVPCTSLELGILGLEALEVEGGGDWGVASSDESVVKAEKVVPEDASYSYLSVSPVQQGKAVVTVTSETGDKIDIPVSVGVSVRKLTVSNGELNRVEGANKEDSVLIVQHLYDDVFVRKGGCYHLTYSGKREGKLLVESSEGKVAEGIFTSGVGCYDFTFGGKSIHYILMYKTMDTQIDTRTEQRLPFYLVEDVTGRYRINYPGIKSVLRAQKVSISDND